MDIRPNVLSKLNQMRPEEIVKYPSDYRVDPKKAEGPNVSRSLLATTRESQAASTAAESMSVATETGAATQLRPRPGSTAALHPEGALTENIPLKPQPESPASGTALDMSSAIRSVTDLTLAPAITKVGNPLNLSEAKRTPPITAVVNRPESDPTSQKMRASVNPDATATSQENPVRLDIESSPMAKVMDLSSGGSAQLGLGARISGLFKPRHGVTPAQSPDTEGATRPRLPFSQERAILAAKQAIEQVDSKAREKKQNDMVAARKTFLVDLATCGSAGIDKTLAILNKMANKGELTKGQQRQAAAFKASGVALNALGVAATVLAFTFPPAAAACLGLAALVGIARMAYTASIGLRMHQGLKAQQQALSIFKPRENQPGASKDPTKALDEPRKKNARLTAAQTTINGIGVLGMAAGAAGLAGSAGLAGVASGIVSNFAPLFGLPGLIVGAGAIVLNTVGNAWANASIKNQMAPAGPPKSISFNITNS